MTKEQIMTRVKEHYKLAQEAFPDKTFLGCFLYGSQNYGVDTPASDVDTKAIIIPSFNELIWDKPISKELHFENGEHCEVKDIREIIKMFKNQNINFVEILFTEYFILNPDFKEEWEMLISAKEEIARYDIYKCTMSIAGQAIHTLKQNPEDGKKVSNALRLYRFLTRYQIGAEYKQCIYLPKHEREYLIKLKEGKIKYEYPEALIEMFEMLKSDYTLAPPTNKEAEFIMRAATNAMIKKSIQDYFSPIDFL